MAGNLSHALVCHGCEIRAKALRKGCGQRLERSEMDCGLLSSHWRTYVEWCCCEGGGKKRSSVAVDAGKPFSWRIRKLTLPSLGVGGCKINCTGTKIPPGESKHNYFDKEMLFLMRSSPQTASVWRIQPLKLLYATRRRKESRALSACSVSLDVACPAGLSATPDFCVYWIVSTSTCCVFRAYH